MKLLKAIIKSTALSVNLVVATVKDLNRISSACAKNGC